jgi:cell division transport system permease protein
VVAISLSLLGTGLLFVKQVDSTRTYWQSKVEISVYLCYADSANPNCHGAVTDTQTAALQQRLKSMSQVQSVTYVSQAQAWALYKQAFSNDQSYVTMIKETDMPPSLEVKLVNPSADYNVVASAVTGAAGVDSVIDEMNILDKFYRLLDGLRNAVVIVALILVVAAVLLVANTIRLSAFNRRRETGIMRLVGASNFYIQLPFLLEGVIAGLLGWVLAAALLVGVKSLLLNNLQQYFNYNVGLSAADLIEVIVLAMVVGILLCGVTSFVTLRRYLRAGSPTGETWHASRETRSSPRIGGPGMTTPSRTRLRPASRLPAPRSNLCAPAGLRWPMGSHWSQTGKSGCITFISLSTPRARGRIICLGGPGSCCFTGGRSSGWSVRRQSRA